MDFWIVPLMAVILSFVAYVVKNGIELEKTKLLAKQGGGDKSLGVSELKGLIRQAVEEANAPLQARILELEAQAGMQEHPSLNPVSRSRRLSDGHAGVAEDSGTMNDLT